MVMELKWFHDESLTAQPPRGDMNVPTINAKKVRFVAWPECGMVMFGKGEIVLSHILAFIRLSNRSILSLGKRRS